MPKKITEAGIQTHLQTLAQTVQRIRDCTAGLDEAQLKAPPAPDEWSALQILAHVRSGVDVWSYSIYAMLTLDNPELAFIHPRAWTKTLRYEQMSFEQNLIAFEIERTNLLRILNQLSFEDWGRTCHFKGKVNTFTIFVQVHRMASHEADHCQQLEAMFS